MLEVLLSDITIYQYVVEIYDHEVIDEAGEYLVHSRHEKPRGAS